MRSLTLVEVECVSGGGIYSAESRLQYRDMVVGAVAGGLMGGPVGFAVGLVAGSITGFSRSKPEVELHEN